MNQSSPIQLKCPRCDASLEFPGHLAGRRVSCGQCGAAVKLPELSSTSNDDDAWLALDTDLDEADGSVDVPLEDDHSPAPYLLPELAAGGASASTPTSGPNQPPPLSEADLAALGGFVDHQSSQPAPVQRVVDAESVDDSFRVRCRVCDSLSYARRDQVGKKIRCPDCHTAIVVPPPPKVKPKYRPDIEAAATYTFSGSSDMPQRPADPFRKSAEDYLRAAEQAEDEPEDQEWELPNFGEWFSGLGKIFLDPAVPIHIILLSMLAFVPVSIAIWLEGDERLVALGRMMLYAGAAIYGALVIACGFAVLQAVANGEQEVSEWPVFDPMEWLGQLALSICAAALAAGPALLLAHLLFPAGLATVAMGMLGLFVFYPIVLLSMLDEQSVMVPFSTDISKSMMRSPDQWGAAYLASGILFFAMFVAYMFSSVVPPLAGALVSIVVTVAGVFIYFAILGRLAYGIGHAVNAPPMVNDIESTRRRRREEISEE